LVGAAVRLRGVGAVGRAEPGPPEPGRSRWPQAAVVVGAVGLGWSVGGPVGWLVASGLGGALVGWLRRAEPADVVAARRVRAAGLPTSVDLLVACLRAGADQAAAVRAVAAATPGSLRADLEQVARRLARGATPEAAWDLTGVADLRPVARVFARSAATGAPAADLLDAVAGDLRAERRESWLADARRLGTRSAAPLGLCFLPGFVLLGVVPIVVGLAGGLW
ncbi:MAG: type II secretion system F family protein, partial [Actinomycetota bacterium]|nr:type II secretion system F family protein [Actinomycetota bacterium]